MRESLMDPDLMTFLRRKIAEHFGKKSAVQVILYGSRSRGDHQPRSDYDLAVGVSGPERKNWSAFFVDVVEDAPTLHKIDLVNLSACPKDLRAQILKEGTVIYEREG